MNKILKQLTELIFIVISKVIPIRKDTVIFESFHGNSYSDSPKYIYEELLNKKRNYKYIWVLKDLKINIPGNVIKVKKNSLKYIWYLYRSEYWIFNSRISDVFPKKENTIYLQTWHGIPLKKLGYDILEYKGPKNQNYKAKLKKCVNRWNYLISANEYSTKIFERCFDFKNEIIEVGYPRNIPLIIQNNLKDIKNKKQKLELPMSKKIILYAPTFRENQFDLKNRHFFELNLDINLLKKELGKDYILLLRLHYNVAKALDLSLYNGFVYDFSKYNDINDLYLVSDLMITDYSSTMFDYALLNRPILFFTYDLEDYRDNLRGFYFDFEKESPGPLILTNDLLIKEIKNISKYYEIYGEKYEIFKNKYCDVVSKETIERVLIKIFK